MGSKNPVKRLYNQISSLFSTRNMVWISMVIFMVLMLPVCYVSFVNRASGDDYGYGTYTRLAWMEAHSIAEVFKAAWKTIRLYYDSWQGTWFSIFLFSLQPEVFHDGAYVITAFLMLFLWVGSTFYLFDWILRKNMGIDTWSYMLITILFLIINIQFIPSTKSSIFWFNGCAHYMIPFTMYQMITAWLLKYSRKYKKSTLTGIIVFMTLMGGANYQAALFALIAALYIGITAWFTKKDKRIFRLIIPVLMETAGLIISMMAPGNLVRGGETFGFSASRVIETIEFSFVNGIKDIGIYVDERPLIFIGLLFLFFIFVETFKKQKKTFHFKHPFLLSAALYCLYSAMQAPAIYAGVDVSRGVLNTNFQVFMLTASGILLIAASKAVGKINLPAEKLHRTIIFPGIIICMILMVLLRSNIKTSTSFVCLSYIITGQAADYKEQMDLQTKLLTEESVQEVVLPGINDMQGPLMHMPVTQDVSAWTNRVTAEFYGKKSVVSMDRPEWIEKYDN